MPRASHITRGSRQDVARCAGIRRFAGSGARSAVSISSRSSRAAKKREKARRLAHGGRPGWRRRDAGRSRGNLQKFAGVRPHPEAFVEALRTVAAHASTSISSSSQGDAGRLSLTVDAVRYIIGKRKRVGVASTFLSERITAGETLPVYVQPAHNFALPRDFQHRALS